MMTFQLAWRNLWRNPRRTGVILAAVIIGVWSMVFLGSLMRGIEAGMITNGIATLTGHLQIRHPAHRRDPVIANRLTAPNTLIPLVERSLPSGANWTSRIRITAVASNARRSAGVTLVGIDPPREAEVSFVAAAVTQGRYLAADDARGIVVGRALLDTFETRLGHKLILMAQDARGAIVSRAFRIVGVFRAELESTERQFVFVSLPAAREMLALPDGVSEIAVLLAARDQVDGVAARLRSGLAADTAVVHTWLELLPLLAVYLRLYNSFIAIWYGVTFVAMGFGIVNTTLMAVFERMREFGMLKALGATSGRIVGEVLLETALMLAVGALAGNLLGMGCVRLLAGRGIDLSALAAGAEFANMARVIHPVIRMRDMVAANLVVVGLGLLISLYPALKAARITPVEALAHT